MRKIFLAVVFAIISLGVFGASIYSGKVIAPFVEELTDHRIYAGITALFVTLALVGGFANFALLLLEEKDSDKNEWRTDWDNLEKGDLVAIKAPDLFASGKDTILIVEFDCIDEKSDYCFIRFTDDCYCFYEGASFKKI